MTAPEFWIGKARQGGFSSLKLPPPGECLPPPDGFVLYVDGGGELATTGGVIATSTGSFSAALSGGPFGEPYFLGQDYGGEIVESVDPLLALGTGDFTVEMWYRFRTGIANNVPSIFEWRNAAGDDGIRAYLAPLRTSTGQQPQPTINIYTLGDAYYHINRTSAINQWRHLAIQRENNVMTAWDHGDVISAVWYDDDYTEPLDYGSITYFSVYGDDAFIDAGQVRITPGVARYFGSSIPVPTAPFYP